MKWQLSKIDVSFYPLTFFDAQRFILLNPPFEKYAVVMRYYLL